MTSRDSSHCGNLESEATSLAIPLFYRADEVCRSRTYDDALRRLVDNPLGKPVIRGHLLILAHCFGIEVCKSRLRDVGCDSQRETQLLEGIEDTSEWTDEEKTWARANLEQMRTRVPRLLISLGSENPGDRLAACLSLAQTLDVRAVPGLIHILQHDSAFGLRGNAAAALGIIGHPAGLGALGDALQAIEPTSDATIVMLGRVTAGRKTIEDAIERIRSGRTAAFLALLLGSTAAVGNETLDVIPGLIALLDGDRSRDPAAADLASFGTAAVPRIVEAFPLLAEADKDEGDSFRQRHLRGALCALQDIGTPAKSAVPAILDIIRGCREGMWDLLYVAVWTVAKIAPDAEPQVVDAIDSLWAKGLLDDDQKNFRRGNLLTAFGHKAPSLSDATPAKCSSEHREVRATKPWWRFW